ncbi:hypothetical protein GY45DRAFT_1376351 [Cubamyces sp. BRFM 1775]|nr:hypothetical protein GY45DRAFT_1376351 [Cubamyces sp. BRFM 1775]
MDRAEEQAHFDALKVRLHTLSGVYQNLGAALETLQVMHTLLGTQMLQLEAYIIHLAPEQSAATSPTLARAQTPPPDLPSKPRNRKLVKHVRSKLFPFKQIIGHWRETR